MSSTQKQKRVVLLAGGPQADALLRAFAGPVLRSWRVTLAEGQEHARFLAGLDACDVLLVDESGLDLVDETDLGFLFSRSKTAVVFLSSSRADLIRQALARGANLWLPHDLVVAQPALLADALRHAVRCQAKMSLARHESRRLLRCRAQIARLADLIWNALPVEGRHGWLTQRYALERLQEEVLRCDRHGDPLTLILGEWSIAPTSTVVEIERRLRAWTVERVLANKRRTDVAGQYGLRGFMLVLPHTAPEGAEEYCRRLRIELEQTPADLPPPWRLHTSLGIAGYSSIHRTPKSLLRLAEEQLGVRSPARE
jgi:hypothetical protein